MSFIGRRPVITKYKQNIEPHEWHAYKTRASGALRDPQEIHQRVYLERHQPKGSAFDLLSPAVPSHWPKTRDYYIVEAAVPREWFQYGRMFQFLTEHRHLKGYSHLFFMSSPRSVTDNCGFDEPFDLIGRVLFRSVDTHPQSRVAVYVKTDAVQLQKSGIGVVERYAP